jgi:adenylate cyclase class IV
MPTPFNHRNLELKVACEPADLDELLARTHQLTCAPMEYLHQIDTYVDVPTGRLKLREIRATETKDVIIRAELIAYARVNEEGSRWSNYEVVPIAAEHAPAMLRALLLNHRELVRIDKLRHVGLIGRTRVHLDRVEGLGAFVELETVMGTQREDVATREHQQVIAALDLDRFPSIAGSYCDLALAAG